MGDGLRLGDMLANNEVGTLQPIPELPPAAGRGGVPLHCGGPGGRQIPVNVASLGVTA